MKVLAAVLVLGIAGCGGDGGRESRTVLASFYPLAWAAERIAGDTAEVVNLTPPGGEPHDVELSPRDVEAIEDARLVLYVGGGFQPAVEDAVDAREGPSLDVLPEDERNPHVWLDPLRFASIAEAIGGALGQRQAGSELGRELRELDEEYRAGLARCARRTLVTMHGAFTFLAERYRLTELALGGTSPEAEPGPRELGRLIAKVRASGATTVFAEPLVSDRLARTVAREAGAEVAVLDPLEGLSKEQLEAGEDYLTIMRRNLEALREALGCR